MSAEIINLSRREIMGAAAAMAVVPPVVITLDPQEPLTVLYAKWKRACEAHTAAVARQAEADERYFVARDSSSPDEDAAWIAQEEASEASRAACFAEFDALEEIIAAEAHGPTGTLIKLLAAAEFARQGRGEDSEGVSDRFIFSLLADAKRTAGGAA